MPLLWKFPYKSRKHPISLEEAITVKNSYLRQALKKPVSQMVKPSIFETNLNNVLIGKLNHFEWLKMGLAMQLPIKNLGFADYLPFGREAGTGTWTGYTTSVTQEGLCFFVCLFWFFCFCFFPSKPVFSCNIMFSWWLFSVEMKYTSPKSQSVTQRSDIWDFRGIWSLDRNSYFEYRAHRS